MATRDALSVFWKTSIAHSQENNSKVDSNKANQDEHLPVLRVSKSVAEHIFRYC
jgi:hypothetical protein